MDEDDVEGVDDDSPTISCSFCGENESLTFVVGSTGEMQSACPRCAAIMQEAKDHLQKHLEQRATYYRDRQDRIDAEARWMLIVAVVLLIGGCTAQWGLGVGAASAAAILTIFALIRIIKD
jgi:uncharacterized C2H2 Zn-finger protein